jgi:hypothetical protein
VGEQVGGQLALGLGAVAVAAVLGQQGDGDVEGPRPRVGPVPDGVVADVAGQGAAVQLDQQIAAVGPSRPSWSKRRRSSPSGPNPNQL